VYVLFFAAEDFFPAAVNEESGLWESVKSTTAGQHPPRQRRDPALAGFPLCSSRNCGSKVTGRAAIFGGPPPPPPPPFFPDKSVRHYVRNCAHGCHGLVGPRVPLMTTPIFFPAQRSLWPAGASSLGNPSFLARPAKNFSHKPHPL